MSKSIYVNLCNKHYNVLIKTVGSILLNEISNQNINTISLSKSIVDGSSLTRIEFINLVSNWWKGETKYLALNQLDIKGLSVRLYKKNFKLTKRAYVF